MDLTNLYGRKTDHSRGCLRKISGKLLLFLDALRKFGGDHGFLLSSAITFNFLICMIPIILLLLALIGQYLYSSREVLNHITYHLQDVIPSLDPQIMKNIMRIIRHRKIVGILGIRGLIWTSTLIFSSLRRVFDIVFQVEKGRGILHGKALDLLMVLLAAGIFFLMSMVLVSAITFAQDYSLSPFLDMKPITRFILKYLIPFFFTFCMSFLIYKIIPKKVHFKSALQAAFFTSLFWEVAKQLFGWYVVHLGRFSIVYGSLSTLAIFFFVVYYSSATLILGAEIAFLLCRVKTQKFREKKAKINYWNRI
jgi:membrane protein